MVDNYAQGGGGGDDEPLGKLSEKQIEKGQDVLKQLKNILVLGGKIDTNRIGLLSSDFYSLIPTNTGFKKPPPIDNIERVTEKEGGLN